jgi:hypothetical protein
MELDPENLKLDVADPATGAQGTCIAPVLNLANQRYESVAVFQAKVDPVGGQLVDAAGCALVVVRTEDELWWMSGVDLDVELRGPHFDGDPVRHSVSTVEDLVETGSFPVRVFELDSDLDADEPLFGFTLEVKELDTDAVHVRLVVDPPAAG